MKRTYRMQRGILSFIVLFILTLLWLFFLIVYPQINIKYFEIDLPYINPNVFLLPILTIIFIQFTAWLVRNKLWYGLSFALNYYFIVKQIRRQIKDAKFENRHEINDHLVKLPKIKIQFDNNMKRTKGKVMIRNSIRFDKQLENIRIDSSLRNYVCEISYLSDDRNWYIYEFYSLDSNKQIEITSRTEFLEWITNTNDYSLRLDGRTTVPFHHIGVVGQTGSGKSFLIQMLIEQIISKEIKHQLYIIDPKRTDIYLMAKRINKRKRVADKNNAIDLIVDFNNEMIRRQTELEHFFEENPNSTYQDANLPALILLIDEFGALRESWKTLPKKERDNVESILSNVAFMGRQLGCMLWIATQQMNAQTLPTAIREQLVLKIALGSSDEQTYRTLYASSVDIPQILFKPGQGVYSYPGMASIEKPRLLSVPYCSFLKTNHS